MNADFKKALQQSIQKKILTALQGRMLYSVGSLVILVWIGFFILSCKEHWYNYAALATLIMLEATFLVNLYWDDL